MRRYYSNVPASQLVLLHILFRHGHRTPTSGFTYKGEPNTDPNYEPYGPGQLTNMGKIGMYKLGEYIRDKYSDFLKLGFKPGVVDATTTNVDRTQASLQLFLAGLFPPKGELVWKKDLLWQPIPYTYRRKNDKVLHTCLHNPTFQNLYHAQQAKIGVVETHRELFAFMSQQLDVKVDDLEYVWRFFVKLQTQKERGLPLPSWTQHIFPKPLEELAVAHYKTQMMTPELREIAIGGLVKKIIDDTRMKMSTKCPVKLHIYSAHELNVAHLLIGVGSFLPPGIPDYCSCLIFEIRETDKDILVAALYKPSINEEAQYLPLWGENPCSFDKFVISLMKNFKKIKT